MESKDKVMYLFRFVPYLIMQNASLK